MQIIKQIVILLIFSIICPSVSGQIVYDNSCSSGLKINLIGSNDAEDVFKEHQGNLKYVNLLLDEGGLIYKGKRYSDVEEFENVYEPPNNIFNRFDVLIGLERSSPIDYFKRLLCTLNEIGSRKFDEINVYFYKGKVQ